MTWRGLSILAVLKDGPRLTRQIAAELDIKHRKTLRDCLGRLAARGLVMSSAGCHQITGAGRAALASGREVISGPGMGRAVTRRGTTLRAMAWRAMRIREAFGLDDLMMLVCDGEEKDAVRNLVGYIRALAAAGYLVPMRSQNTGSHPERWRLTNKGNTGPEAPAWNKARGLVKDSNTGHVFKVRPDVVVTSAAGIVRGGKA